MYYIINILMLTGWAERVCLFILVSLDWPKQNKNKRRDRKELSVTFKPSYGYGKNVDNNIFPGRCADVAINTSPDYLPWPFLRLFMECVLRWWWSFEPSGMEMLINMYVSKSIILKWDKALKTRKYYRRITQQMKEGFLKEVVVGTWRINEFKEGQEEDTR